MSAVLFFFDFLVNEGREGAERLGSDLRGRVGTIIVRRFYLNTVTIFSSGRGQVSTPWLGSPREKKELIWLTGYL